MAGSPAAKAGLRPRDVVVRLDGEPVADVGGLQSLLTERFIGREVGIELVRDGQLETCRARCGELRWALSLGVSLNISKED